MKRTSLRKKGDRSVVLKRQKTSHRIAKPLEPIPIELLLDIFNLSPTLSAWRALLGFKEFALWSLSDEAKQISDVMFTIKTVKADGYETRKGRLLHSLNDEPAFVYRKSYESSYDIIIRWYRNGKTHRLNDLPALIKSHNNRETEYLFAIDGKCHREYDKPARYIISGPYKENEIPEPRSGEDEVFYFKNGYLHRDGGLPAVFRKNGCIKSYEYWSEGKLLKICDVSTVSFL